MIKQLLNCVGQYKKESVITPILVVLEGAVDVAIPFLMADMIDQGISPGRTDVILRFGGILISAAFLSLLLGVLSGDYAARAAAGFARNLRQKMFHAIQDFSFSNIDKFSAASLVTRLTTDVTNVQNAYQMIIRIAVRSPVMLIFSLIMAFAVSPKISLIFLAIVPFLGLGFYFIISRVHPIFVRVFKTYDRLNNVVRENLRGIRVVKSFVREDYEKKKFNAVSQKICRDFTRAERILAFNSPLMQFSIYCCIILISWFGAKLVVSSEMTTGELLSVIFYASYVLISLMMLSMVFVMVIISRSSAERIEEVLEEKAGIKNPANPVFEIKSGEAVFKNVSFSYTDDPKSLCLKEINLEIRSGETVGIVGGTGSSKTTLVQLIPRLYDTTRGAVFVGGVNVRDYDIKTLREGVAVVLQKNMLFSGTVKENLRWGNPEASDKDLVRACRLAQADEFIRSLPEGYDTLIDQGGANLSGGQKQRLCIARALLKNPKILILDDSTSAVDTKTEALIWKSFREELPDVTKFIIAQRVSSVMTADKIVVMDKGEVNGFGTHDKLLKTNAIYREFCQSQTRDKNEEK